MKKMLALLLIVIMIISVELLQIYFFNGLDFFGIKANFILVSVIVMVICMPLNISLPYTAVVGILTDLIFAFSIGKNFLAFGLVAIIICFILRRYNKESVLSSFICFVVGTIAFELILYIYNSIQTGYIVNVFTVLLVIFKLTIINSILGLLLYKLLLAVNRIFDR